MTPEQAAAVAKIREAIDNQPAHKAQRDDPVPVKADDLRTILAALDAAQAAAQAPQSEAGWLHRLDMEKTAAWQQGYAQGQHRAAQAPREAPRLTPEQIAKALAPLYSDPRAAEMGLPDDIRTARIVEGLVRKLCGVAP